MIYNRLTEKGPKFAMALNGEEQHVSHDLVAALKFDLRERQMNVKPVSFQIDS